MATITKPSTRAARRRAQRSRAKRGGRAFAPWAWALGALLVAAAVVALVVTVGGGEGGTEAGVTVEGPARSAPLPEDARAPDFAAPLLGGGTGSLYGDTPGPAVVVFWSPWCPHCQEEVPLLAGVAAAHPEVSTAGVVIWPDARPGPSAGAVASRSKVAFPNYLDDTEGTIASAYGIGGTPTLYVLDEGQRVVGVANGAVAEADLERIYDSLG